MGERVKDPRLAALARFAAAITVFNIVGHLLLGFEQSWATPFTALAAAYTCELILELVQAWSDGRPLRWSGQGAFGLMKFLLPAHITGLAVSMLLYPNQRLMPIAFAASAAIASKYLFRVTVGGRARHFFNPSNFGISATLVLFPWVGLAMPYMFTENLYTIGDWALPALIVVTGTFLNAKYTKKMPLILTWVGLFATQAVMRSVVFGTPLGAPVNVMTGLAFVLFTFYMVSDPSTTPRSTRGQILFGGSVATVYGLLISGHVVFTLFFALTVVCLGRGIGLWFSERMAARQAAPARVPVTIAADGSGMLAGSAGPDVVLRSGEAEGRRRAVG